MSERPRQRSAVRPGLECPRVLRGDPNICPYQNQFENDVWYAEHVSFATDVKMIFLLFKMTFNTKKRSGNAVGKGYFAGYDSTLNATSLKRFQREFPEEWEQLTALHS